VTDGKKIIAFFTFYDFLSVKNRICGVEPILSIYSINVESKIGKLTPF
jgi:hypothetical protein